MTTKTEREIKSDPDKFDYQDVPVDKERHPKNEAAYMAAYKKARGKA